MRRCVASPEQDDSGEPFGKGVDAAVGGRGLLWGVSGSRTGQLHQFWADSGGYCEPEPLPAKPLDPP